MLRLSTRLIMTCPVRGVSIGLHPLHSCGITTLHITVINHRLMTDVCIMSIAA